MVPRHAPLRACGSGTGTVIPEQVRDDIREARPSFKKATVVCPFLPFAVVYFGPLNEGGAYAKHKNVDIHDK